MDDVIEMKPNPVPFEGGLSALAREVRQLKQSQLKALGITDDVISIWDFSISSAVLLTDESRPWEERFTAVIDRFRIDLDSVNPEHLEVAVRNFNKFAGTDLPKWATDIKRQGFRVFVRRLIGPAAFGRCEQALREDGAIIANALRWATRKLMPYAVALDDLYAVLPPERANEVPLLAGAPGAILELIVRLDQAFEDKVRDWELPVALMAAREAEDDALDVSDIVKLGDDLRQIVNGRSRDVVAGLSGALHRKLQGARDAIEHSADPVAQAANSLIELLDRILRAAFTDDEVIDWVQRNYPDAKDMTYTSADALKPTKRAQALCFAHAGQEVPEPSLVHELAATAIVGVRRSLQQLKHSDKGTEEEQEAILRYLAAVEAYMTLVVGIVWAGLPEEEVQRFRERLE